MAATSTWAGLHLDDVERTVAAGAQLGWGRSWIDQVCVVGLAFVCLTSGCTLGRLNEAVFEATTAALDASVSVAANHRRVIHGRLLALRQVCFPLGVHDAPPTHPNIRERSLTDQLGPTRHHHTPVKSEATTMRKIT